ncbi:hypothetical protein PMI35_05348, partial [Pseudomonas sp. GM78]
MVFWLGVDLADATASKLNWLNDFGPSVYGPDTW